MNKHKTLPVFWATLSLLFLVNVRPGLAQSRTPNVGKPGGIDTLFNCTWTSATAAPALLLDAPTVTVGSNMYLFGGIQGGATSAASFKFDGTTWTPIAPLPLAVEFAAAVTDGTDIYIMGGAEPTVGTPQTTLWRYNVALNTYTVLAPFTLGTWNHSAVYLNGKIYKWCGTGPSTASANALEIYTIATNTWTAGAAYPLLISFTSGWTQGGFIYSAGGIQSVGSVASAKTYRYDPVANTWDDASIADLPATRWGAATAFYSPDVVLAGGYVAGFTTPNISNTAISWDQPSNTWNTVPNMPQARARMTGAVLNGSVYVVGGRCTTVGVCDLFQGTNDNQKLTCLNVPTNIMSSSGSSIVSAGPNGVLDPAENVTVALGAKNIGGPGVVCTTAALTGTLQASGGVTVPSGSQVYGVVCSGGGPTVYKNYSFTVDGALACGATVTATVQMQDGATNYGNLTYTFVTGSSAIAFAQNFDGVVAPALPAGWTSTLGPTNIVGVPWVTSTTTPFSAPNDAFSPDGSNIGDSYLDSPPIAVPAAGATLTFKNNYITEATFDGEVLEISINGGAFSDIITAGGSFVTGGYTGPISTSFNSPIAGRQAWNGTSTGGYITSTVNLPPSSFGQMAVLRWRMASDSSLAATGVWIDDISIANPVCNTTSPTVNSAVSRKTQGGAGDFDVPLPLVPLAGAVGIEDRAGAVAGAHTMVVTFANPVTVGVAAVSAGAGAAGSSVAGNVVMVNLTGVSDAQRMEVTLSNVSDGVNLGSIHIPMGLLNGDTNGNGSVNAGDAAQTKGQSGIPVGAGNFRNDVNSNGSINAGDVGLVKSKAGNVLPP